MSEYKHRILIIDDEVLVRNFLQEILTGKFDCTTAGSAEDALKLLPEGNFDLVLSDIEMKAMSGIELLPHVHRFLPDAIVIMISGNKDIESAIKAMRVGAFDYIQKPFEIGHVEIAVDRALTHHKLLVEKRRYENHLEKLVKERTERLNYLSYHDALTELPNRALFEDRLSQALLAARRDRKSLAVALICIDRFKNFQDTLGHNAVVEILRRFANRIRECAGGELNTTARFEGSEFALLINGIENTEAVGQMVGCLGELLKAPLKINRREIFLTSSIGISVFDGDNIVISENDIAAAAAAAAVANPAADSDVATLLRQAGIALSRAAEQKDGISGISYQFYETEMNARSIRRLELENKLRWALERDEFELFYQPKIDSLSGKITGSEALIRWRHPELGIISPAEFIPVAEETGFIVPLGEWILRTACRQNKKWHDEGYPLHIAVNLSVKQFREKNLTETIYRAMRDADLHPQFLELEVTESSLMKNAADAVEALGELRTSGVSIAIDDFGTGYSSLSYLKNLPVDVLKIDKSFISDVDVNSDDASLVTAIVSLAHNLRLKVVAEGVEKQAQLNLLNTLNCDAWQGFLCSRPVPADSFKKLLVKGH